MDDRRPTVFLIDDDDSVRRGLARLLISAGLKVAAFPSAEAFLEHKRRDGCGCIVLDVCMGGLSGTGLQARLVADGCDLPIVFLSGHGSIPLSVGAMKQGAVDFLTKPVDDEVLLAAVRQSLARHEAMVRRRTELAAARERMASLTARELEVMRCVLSGALNKQIASRLGIAEKTVKVHRARVMEKLDIGSVADLVRFCEAAGVPAIGPERA